MATIYRRGKSNISTPYTKPLPPGRAETGEIKVNVNSGYTPSPERLAREAKEKQEADRIISPKTTKRGMLKNRSSDFWDTFGDDVEYVEETNWSPLKSNIPQKDEIGKSDNNSHETKSNVKPSFWDNLGDGVEYLGETDWSEFRKRLTVVVEADTENKNSEPNTKRKTRVRRTGKSKSSSAFSIRRCKKCMLDCEYGAYLCGGSTDRPFKINKSTCPKR